MAGKRHRREGGIPHRLVALDALFHHEEIGVEFRVSITGDELHFQPGGQSHGEETQGGFLPSAVTIKEALDLIVIATEQGELTFGDRRALGGHGGFETDTPGAQCVQLSLDQNEGMAFFRLRAGPVEIEEEVALSENRGLR